MVQGTGAIYAGFSRYKLPISYVGR
jgi:hypothetical protein